MPPERRKHSKWGRFRRQNRELVLIGILTLIILAIVFGLFYLITSSRFATHGSLG
jgi:hypothetical protein